MIAEQRLSKILQIISEQGFVEISDLSERLNVSAMTIRRDLQKLSERGIIRRKYGGAMLVANISAENDYYFKKEQNLSSKQHLAQIALSLIHDNDILFLDAGTTTFELACLLQKKQNLTIITNDLAIMLELAKKDIQVLSLGGVLQNSTLSTIGPISVENLRHYQATTAFLGANAISSNYDVLTPTPDKAYLKKVAMDVSQKSYLMVDSSKFNSYALNRYANLSDFTAVITDRVFSQEEQLRLNKYYINILSV